MTAKKATMGRPKGQFQKFTPNSIRNSRNYNVWRSIRVMRRFTAFELLATVQVEQRDTYERIANYLKKLQDAEYIAGHRIPPQATVYRLLRDTGPHAPMPRSNGTVFDPNLNKCFGEAWQ